MDRGDIITELVGLDHEMRSFVWEAAVLMPEDPDGVASEIEMMTGSWPDFKMVENLCEKARDIF